MSHRTAILHRSHKRRCWGQNIWTPELPTRVGNVTPEHWYKADAGIWQDAVGGTPAAADGDPVGVWEDQTANQDDVSQAVAGSKPALRLAIKNGMPVLRFDGTADYLQGAYTTGGALAQPFTVFAVAQLDASAVDDGTDCYIMDSDDAVNRSILGKSLAYIPDKWITYASVCLVGNACNSNWNIWTVQLNGASSAFWHNGLIEGAGNAGAHTPDGITVGANHIGGNPWKGDIPEIIIYAGNLSDADKNQIGSYFEQRYGISYTKIS